MSDRFDLQLREAVIRFWTTRANQSAQQKTRGQSDQGSRSAVTGGHQMDGFIDLISSLVVDAGVNRNCIFTNSSVELPGYYRPTKKWDLLVVVDQTLLAVVEVKSQIGPSFGNNFNNRVEEALGSATDLWTAYREGAFKTSPRPWLGYLFLLEDCEKSRNATGVQEPHFDVFPEFKSASYCRRYEIFLRKLLRERCYDGAAFITSNNDVSNPSNYAQPADDLGFDVFARSLQPHIRGAVS